MPHTCSPLPTVAGESMNICLVDGKFEVDPSPIIEKLRHTITSVPNSSTDIILLGTFFSWERAREFITSYPKAKFAIYCWDYYKWAHEGKHTLNWRTYASLLQKADAVMVPSIGQQLRLRELLGIESEVVHTYVEVKNRETSDQRFVLDPVRFYPEENERWVVEAGERLGIPVIHSEHQYTLEEFDKLVATCSYITCGYREASTGGLPLVQGLWNGKVSLISDSPYMGANDYLGPFAVKFDHESRESLEESMQYLWDNKPSVIISAAREWIHDRFTPEKMARKISDVCERLLS